MIDVTMLKQPRSLVDQCILAIKSREELIYLKQFETIRERMFVMFDVEKQKRDLDEVQLRYGTGQAHTHAYYRDGELHGEHRVWRRNGILLSISNFRRGTQHGPYILYHADGRVWRECTWERGEIVNDQYVYEYIRGRQYRCVYRNNVCVSKTEIVA